MVTGHRSKSLLPESLRPLERDLKTSEEKLLAFMAEGVNPPKVVYATFPQTGVWAPIPSGRTTFDLVAMRVSAPNGDSALDSLLRYEEIRSFIIAVDAVCAVEAQPTNQKFVMPPGVIEINSRDIEKVIFQSDVPFLMQLAWGTSLNGTDLWVPYVTMLRYTSTALTKTNGAGVADSFSALAFVPYVYSTFSGQRTLDQALYGGTILSTLGFGNKCFICRNTSLTIAVDVVVRGGIHADVGTVYGLVNDPDIGAGGGSPITIPPNSAVVLPTSTPFAIMQVLARVSAAEAANASSTLIVEVHSQLPGGGEG